MLSRQARAALLVIATALAAELLSALPVAAQPRQPAPPISIQAEDASSSGTEVASEIAGFAGSGYVSGFGSPGDILRFDISVPQQDYYTLRFRYLNTGSQPAVRTLRIDGERAPTSLVFRNVRDGSSGGAVRWLTVDESLRLTAGAHTVTLAYSSQADRGNVLVDQLDLLDETQASTVSTRSLLMNNWDDLIGIHHSSMLAPDDRSDYGPRLAALHWKGDWRTNELDGATAYFRDDTADRNYTDLHRFDSNLYFTPDGVMNVDYLSYGDEPLAVDVRKRYAMVPDEHFLIVSYNIANPTGEQRSFSLLEVADLNNLAAGAPQGHPGEEPNTEASGSTSETISATWNDDYDAWIADMSATNNGAFLVFGALSLPGQSHDLMEPGEDQKLGKSTPLIESLENQQDLRNESSLSAPDLLLAIKGTAQVPAQGEADLSFFYSVQPSSGAALLVAQRVREREGAAAWLQATRDSWNAWLSTGRSSVTSGDPGVDQAYHNNLVVLRQMQHPEFGSFPASTNPAYFYKVWPRDATVSALSLDAAGYYDQAEKYWMWMAEVQEEGDEFVAGQQDIQDFPDGTWFTNYSYWQQNLPLDFVQPEWDSIGQFLIGVYHHWRLLQRDAPERATTFLDEIYAPVVDSATWIADNITGEGGVAGLGPPGFSVWEEDFEYNTYTQTTYASGLNAARLLAEQRGDSERAQVWLDAARTIRDSMLAPVGSSDCGGLWDPEQQYFLRAIYARSATESGECEPHAIYDGSSDLIWVFGLLPVDDPKALAHRETMLDRLTPPYSSSSTDGGTDSNGSGISDPRGDFGVSLGLSRYEGDEFYHTAGFSPGGKYESTVAMPSWPWMTSYMSMADHWLGMDELSFARIQWYVSVTPVGFMPTGEGVDWNRQEPLPSTASQPDDGGYNLQIALLNYLDVFDPRLPPLE